MFAHQFHFVEFIYTMRTNLPKTFDPLIFSIYLLKFFVTNQLNISKLLPPQRPKTLHSSRSLLYYSALS